MVPLKPTLLDSTTAIGGPKPFHIGHSTGKSLSSTLYGLTRAAISLASSGLEAATISRPIRSNSPPSGEITLPPDSVTIKAPV